MSKVFVIGEIGINANGDLNLAKILIDGAVDAGCDAIKFQKRTVDKVYSKELLDSPRDDGNPYGWKTQREQKNGIEFGEREYNAINTYCKERNIEWFASAWDIDSQLFLRQYNLRYNKIASPMLTNLELLKAVAEEGKYTFISTGMSIFKEIDEAVDIFSFYNCPFEIMHCNSAYPSLNKDANLFMIDILRQKYGKLVGYSSHENGRIVAMAAVARGAISIEKHISFNRDEKTYELIKEHLIETKVKEYNSLTGDYDDVVKILPYGSDQWASLTIRDMKKLIIDIRQLEPALDVNITKNFSKDELTIRKKLRGV